MIFFHLLVLQEYLVLTENRIPLKPLLGGMRRIVALSISSHEQTQLHLVCCFFYNVFSLFLKDPFFQIILGLGRITLYAQQHFTSRSRFHAANTMITYFPILENKPCFKAPVLSSTSHD